jgi:membrane protease YdiL (CAAX protease family)
MPELVESEAPAEVHVRPEAVAPWPHTLVILAVLALWAVCGAFRSPLAMVGAMPRSIMYTGQMVMQYLLVGSTIAGLYDRRRFILGVFGSPRARNIFGDIGKGFLVYLSGMAVVVVLGVLMRPAHLVHKQSAVLAIAPHSRGEMALWILVSMTAGLCEEFVFRGYLLQQLTRWLRSAGLAVGVGALLFACMHFYEGGAAVVQIAGLGVVYGIVAVRRGNLRQAMVAHFFQDAITGLFLYLHR